MSKPFSTLHKKMLPSAQKAATAKTQRMLKEISMMKNYWSCSKFADWLRGTSKPFAATSEEWRTWQDMAKEKKFRYWLAEEGLDHLQNFVTWPKDQAKKIRCYINNRWISKSHALTSSLERGQWYDFDMRLLYSAFDELVNFVEIELASSSINSSEKKYKSSWGGRSPEAEIDHLKWASELKNKNNGNLNDRQPSRQALAAQETLALYQWWKVERPNRPDPNSIASQEKLNLENKQDDEDTAMLIRLVKIRQSLWT